MNIVQPFCPTSRKCLKTLAGGDPNGVPISEQLQREWLSNHALFAPIRREGTESECLTLPTPRIVRSTFAICARQAHRPLRCQGRDTDVFPQKTALFDVPNARTLRERIGNRAQFYRTFTALASEAA